MKRHSPRHTHRTSTALAALALAMPMAGCLSFTVAETGASRPVVEVSRDVAKDPSNQIYEIAPVAKRSWSQSAELSFDLIGSVKVAELTKTETRRGWRQRLAFGFFPGAACDDGFDAQAGTAFKSIWYNIAFVGIPTVSGLLVEPFVHADREMGSDFSRSAIFGFHRWNAKPCIEKDARRARGFREVVQLKDYSCEFAGTTSYADNDGICRVSPVPEGAKTIEVKVFVPQRHPLMDKLAPFINAPITIRIQDN